ncbi:hypothetical protein BDF19DRAFT_325675 [Syncephalis fuscata]|nr:hypothetical protein BDF19DRAFT_325675 [Syncephalis fuscata]
MPFINYTDPTQTEWRHNAKKQWGIPLNPLGEISVPDFLVEASGHIDEQRLRLSGIQIQIVFSVLMLCIFAHNIVITTKMTISRPHSKFSWCCLILAAVGTICNIMQILMLIGYGLNCRMLLWSAGNFISLGMIFNSLILLLKVHLVLYQKKWITYVGILLILPQIGYGFIVIYYCFFTLEAKLGCDVYYPPILLWYWIGVNTPINVFFSIIFCSIALKQYHLFGSDAWKELAQDGIQAICLALLTNLVCCIAIVSRFDDANRDVLFASDWMIVATILIRHCQNMGNENHSAYRPKTYHILHLSQIATAK